MSRGLLDWRTRLLADSRDGFKKDDKMRRALGTLLGLLCGACGIYAQSDVPILSGALAFIGSKTGGAPSFQPIIGPLNPVPTFRDSFRARMAPAGPITVNSSPLSIIFKWTISLILT